LHEVLQHTADIRIRVVAPTREELFREAVDALMEAMKPVAAARIARVARDDIAVESPDLTSLLVDFLGEVLLRCHTRRHSWSVVRISLTDQSADAELKGTPVEHFEEDVKAVTYHEADVRQTGDGWTTTLVLDV
jgi:SHS2 domain-containing protein